ncbi:MAG TPA: aminotransferase class V-fold PLP-dependent enzyme [Steroidobacter sp.]|uniref:aminotransferase class V-fold PLP-dependent enzyme n=1 Tax=Steroidobacter sp. TaxID=1978227 RepID=UPI002ED98326
MNTLVTRRRFGRLAVMTALAARLGDSAALGIDNSRAQPENWRSLFPGLDQGVQGQPLIYLDSAATTQRAAPVLDAIIDFYRHDNANPGAALHELAQRARRRYEGARQTVAKFLNAASAEEIVWVRGTTEGVNLVATAWARAYLRRNDEILLTIAEHASNLLPWRFATEATGARVRFVDVDEEGRISLQDLDRKLSARTRIVAFSHVSNVVGYINPVEEISARAHRAGARVFVDAAQSAPHIPLDVQALGCDALAFSSHKMLGPMGIGILWARADMLEEMSPYQAGSNMAHEVDIEGEVLERGAHKFGAGTPNVADAIGLAAAIDLIHSLGREPIARHEAALTAHMLETMADVPGLRLLGPRTAERRIPVFSFTLAGTTPREVLRQLNSQGIAIRAGDLSALPLLKRFGVTEAARASCHLYTSIGEIDRFATALASIRRRSKVQ